MDWRRLEAARAPASPVVLAELRPSIRDFTRYLGTGRHALALVPLFLRRDPLTSAPMTPIADLAAFAGAADDLEIAGMAVATEPRAFGGRLADLTTVAAAVSAPLLRYDCVADEHRLYESRAAGADAVLVPVAVVGDALPRLMGLARALHVAVVAEVADASECSVASAAGAPVIAIPGGALALAAQIPARCPILALDGVDVPGDLARLRGVVDGAVIGRAICAAPDPLACLASFAAAAAAL
jgi:indole-3-glycerol phosphate synthase